MMADGCMVLGVRGTGVTPMAMLSTLLAMLSRCNSLKTRKKREAGRERENKTEEGKVR